MSGIGSYVYFQIIFLPIAQFIHVNNVANTFRHFKCLRIYLFKHKEYSYVLLNISRFKPKEIHENLVIHI